MYLGSLEWGSERGELNTGEHPSLRYHLPYLGKQGKVFTRLVVQV